MQNKGEHKMYKIAVLSGDGIGPEITVQAKKPSKKQDKNSEWNLPLKKALWRRVKAIDETGIPLPDKTISLCERSDAILFGAVGGPKWDGLESKLRPEQAILGLEKSLSYLQT